MSLTCYINLQLQVFASVSVASPCAEAGLEVLSVAREAVEVIVLIHSVIEYIYKDRTSIFEDDRVGVIFGEHLSYHLIHARRPAMNINRLRLIQWANAFQHLFRSMPT